MIETQNTDLEAEGSSPEVSVHESSIFEASPDNMNEAELYDLVDALIDYTFLPENIPAAELRMKIKDRVSGPLGDFLCSKFRSARLNGVLDLLEALLYAGYTKELIRTASRDSVVKLLEGKDSTLMVKKIGEQLVAMGGLRKAHKTMPDGREIYELTKVAVLASEQGQGYGSKIMTTLIEEARRRYPDAVLTTASMNPRVIKFFEKRGWKAYDWGDDDEFSKQVFTERPDANARKEWVREYEKMKDAGYKNLIFDPKEQS